MNIHFEVYPNWLPPPKIKNEDKTQRVPLYN